MAANEFLPWATESGANVVTQSDYANDPTRGVGFVEGVLVSAKTNKAWRQASFVAAATGQMITDTIFVDVLDDGDIATFQTNFVNTIKQIALDVAGGDAPADNLVYGRRNNLWVRAVSASGDSMTGSLTTMSPLTLVGTTQHWIIGATGQPAPVVTGSLAIVDANINEHRLRIAPGPGPTFELGADGSFGHTGTTDGLIFKTLREPTIPLGATFIFRSVTGTDVVTFSNLGFARFLGTVSGSSYIARSGAYYVSDTEGYSAYTLSYSGNTFAHWTPPSLLSSGLPVRARRAIVIVGQVGQPAGSYIGEVHYRANRHVWGPQHDTNDVIAPSEEWGSWNTSVFHVKKPILLAADPIDPLHAVTKRYVDALTAGGIGPVDDRYVNTTGDVMTGDLAMTNGAKVWTIGVNDPAAVDTPPGSLIIADTDPSFPIQRFVIEPYLTGIPPAAVRIDSAGNIHAGTYHFALPFLSPPANAGPLIACNTQNIVFRAPQQNPTFAGFIWQSYEGNVLMRYHSHKTDGNYFEVYGRLEIRGYDQATASDNDATLRLQLAGASTGWEVIHQASGSSIPNAFTIADPGGNRRFNIHPGTGLIEITADGDLNMDGHKVVDAVIDDGTY